MLSKNKIKYIQSLEHKKKRKEEKVFVAEGTKLVEELLEHFHCTLLIATAEWLKQYGTRVADEVIEVTKEELIKASFLKTPQDVLAVFKQPVYSPDMSVINSGLCLALDGIQDPGNLGTIIRLADWFGLEHIFCSNNTVDVYNPKVVQASMGGIARVRVHYCDLSKLLSEIPGTAVYGTFLDGDNIYNQPLTNTGLIVMGNEGNGISSEIESFINKRLFIPNYPSERNTTESLNVAIATAVICAEFRRQEQVSTIG